VLCLKLVAELLPGA